MIIKLSEKEILEKLKENKLEKNDKNLKKENEKKEYPFIEYLEIINNQLKDFLPNIEIKPYEEVQVDNKVLLKFRIKVNSKKIFLFLSNEYVCYNYPFFQEDQCKSFNRSYNVCNSGELTNLLNDIINNYSEDVILEKRYNEQFKEVIEYISKKYDISYYSTKILLKNSYNKNKNIFDSYNKIFKIKNRMIILECNFTYMPISLNIVEEKETPFKNEHKETISALNMKNDIDKFFLSLQHKGLLKKDVLYKNEEFIKETMLTPYDALKKFNNNLLKLTSYPKEKNIELNNIEDCIFQINKIENEIEEKRLIFNKLNDLIVEIEKESDSENIIICKDNLKKSKLIIDNDTQFLTNLYSNYLKLSQEYIKKRVDKYLKD